MPSAEHLPQSLRDLAYRNAFQISHARWNMDLEILVRTLRPYVNSAAAASFKTSFLQRLQILSRLPLLRFRMTWTVALLFAIIVFSGFYLKLRKPSTQVAGTNQIPTLMPPSMKDPSSGITGIPNHIPDSEQIASRKYSEMLLAAQHLVWPVPVAGDMRGTWENKKPSAFCNAVDKVELTGQFGTTDPVMIHAWGRCGKKSIDWGESTIRVYQGRTECDYNFDTGSLDQQSRVTLTFVLASGGLFVNSDNTIYQSPTPFPDQEQFLFTKISGPRVARASRDKIDWR